MNMSQSTLYLIPWLLIMNSMGLLFCYVGLRIQKISQFAKNMAEASRISSLLRKQHLCELTWITSSTRSWYST